MAFPGHFPWGTPIPYTAAKRPTLSEPLGGLLALLGGLYEDDVRAVLIRGGLSDYQSLLDSPFTYVPFDTAEWLSAGLRE